MTNISNPGLTYVLEKLDTVSPFGFIRFGDGEYSLMRFAPVVGVDGWISPNHKTRLGERLSKVLFDSWCDYFKGISIAVPGSCCNPEMKGYFFYHLSPDIPKYCANLFVNGNYPIARQSILTALKKIGHENLLIVHNEEGTPFRRTSELQIFSEAHSVPRDGVSWFEDETRVEHFILGLLNSSKKVMVFCSGPLSNVLIPELWRRDPSRIYLDVGSLFDVEIFGKFTRPYQNPADPTYKGLCGGF